jgi:hypothetical protein
MLHPARPGPPLRFLYSIPKACLPGEGMVWLGWAAFADVAPLGELWPWI